MNKDGLIDSIMSSHDLPVLNANLIKLNKIIFREEKINFRDIAVLIEKDVGLSGKVLQLANSLRYCSRYGKIVDIEHAVSRLGIKDVINIVLTFKCMDILKKYSSSIDLNEFWRHSVSVAMISRNIASEKGGSPGDAYLAGLFHDAGIILMSNYLREEYDDIIDEASEKEKPLFEVEFEMLGVNHAEVSAALMMQWNISIRVVNAVRCHHIPALCEKNNRNLCSMIYLADFACSTLGAPEPGYSLFREQSYSIWDDLGIDMVDMQEIIDQVGADIQRSNDFVAAGL